MQKVEERTEMMKDTFTLLKRGEEAFPVILQSIREARESVFIRMFVWRDDVIGRTITEALLDAAKRGVQVDIVKDRCGSRFEYSEEGQSSLIHAGISPSEDIQILVMEALYNPSLLARHRAKYSPQHLRLDAHPDIHVSGTRNLYDHSKVFIFDHRKAIFGGINIEDKENGQDRYGRSYSDLMVMTDSESVIRRLESDETADWNSADPFCVRNIPNRKYEIKEAYSRILAEAQSHIFIIMPYFSPVKDIMDLLYEALDHGVTVEILEPENSNFVTDLNRKTLSDLLAYAGRSGGSLHLYLTPAVTHTKLICTDRMICFGSANITKKSFYRYGETNLMYPNDDSPFALSVRRYIEEEKEKAEEITDPERLRYSPARALAESFVL